MKKKHEHSADEDGWTKCHKCALMKIQFDAEMIGELRGDVTRLTVVRMVTMREQYAKDAESDAKRWRMEAVRYRELHPQYFVDNEDEQQ